MLTQRAVIPYLLRRGLITEAAIVDGNLVVRDASRRNLNFQIISENGPCYLLKQGMGPGEIETVAHEAAIYQRLQLSNGDSGVSRYLPRFFGYDAQECIFIVEFLRDAQTLREYHDHRGRFPVALAAAMGTALSTLHRLDVGERDTENSSTVKISPPGIFSIHSPDLGMLQQLSGATIQAIKIIQGFPEFCELLDQLSDEWVNERLIHFDIKWDNCLILPPRSRGCNIALRIVDWELAGIGDPCWDIGSVFNDYLSYWLNSIPITDEAPIERFVQLARHPLGKMHPAINSFWKTYSSCMELDTTLSAEWLVRSIKYAAARLVQTVCEATSDSIRLTGNSVCALQLSLNMLRQPREALAHLLGIPVLVGVEQ
jgi:hypothetical protein